MRFIYMAYCCWYSGYFTPGLFLVKFCLRLNVSKVRTSTLLQHLWLWEMQKWPPPKINPPQDI